MKKVNYQSDAHKELAGKLYGEYMMQASQQQDAVLIDNYCWVSRFLAMVTREENWIYFQISYEAGGPEYLVDLVKWGFRFPGNFKMPVHNLTRKKRVKL